MSERLDPGTDTDTGHATQTIAVYSRTGSTADIREMSTPLFGVWLSFTYFYIYVNCCAHATFGISLGLLFICQIARMDNNANVKKILTASSPLADWKLDKTIWLTSTWMKTVRDDPKSHQLTLTSSQHNSESTTLEAAGYAPLLETQARTDDDDDVILAQHIINIQQ